MGRAVARLPARPPARPPLLQTNMAPLLLRRPTPSVEWKKKDESLGQTSGQLDKHGRWFHFRSIGLNDDGEYECKAWNIHGVTRHSFTVTVEGQHVQEPD